MHNQFKNKESNIFRKNILILFSITPNQGIVSIVNQHNERRLLPDVLPDNNTVLLIVYRQFPVADITLQFHAAL